MKAYSFEVDSLVHNHNIVTIQAESEEEAWQKLKDGKFEWEGVFTYEYDGDDRDFYTAWCTEEKPTAYFEYLEPPVLTGMVNLEAK